jgi:hypothetical protein
MNFLHYGNKTKKKKPIKNVQKAFVGREMQKVEIL